MRQNSKMIQCLRKMKVISVPKVTSIIPSLPFPSRHAKSQKQECEKVILEIFYKVQVNIPLLDAIKQVSCYAKFLKALCTIKSKLNNNEVISVGENAYVVLQTKLPPKCKDLGSFTIPCILDLNGLHQTQVDLCSGRYFSVGS